MDYPVTDGATGLETVSMRLFLLAALLVSVLAGAPAQGSRSDAGTSDKEVLNRLQSLADHAHEANRIDQEISFRQRLSEKLSEDYVRSPKRLNKYDLYNFTMFNDIPLALLLEGTHHWAQAEQMFRQNQARLSRMGIAGDDIKSENQLLLAYLLASEGQQPESNNICHHWKTKVHHLADGYLWAMKHDEPRIPPGEIADTNEIEIAAWDLACGYAQDGLPLIEQQKAAHPYMLRSYDVLRDYYEATGEFEKALREEQTWKTLNALIKESHAGAIE